MDGSCIFCNYEAIFPQSFRHFQHTFDNVEWDAVYQSCKIPCLDFGAHHENFVSVRCDLQNGVHVVDPFRAKRVVVGGHQIWAVRWAGKDSLCHLCDCLVCAKWCECGIILHVPDRTNCIWMRCRSLLCLISAQPRSSFCALSLPLQAGRFGGLSLIPCLTALRMPDPTSHFTHINGMLPTHTVQAPVNL
jgi:hypothetical protein